MEIYLNCPPTETNPTDLIRQILTRYHLQDEFLLPSPDDNPASPFNIIKTVSTSALTVITTLSTGGPTPPPGLSKDGAISQLVKALEALINRNVEVKITYNNATVDVSGSVGSIEHSLKSLLK